MLAVINHHGGLTLFFLLPGPDAFSGCLLYTSRCVYETAHAPFPALYHAGCGMESPCTASCLTISSGPARHLCFSEEARKAKVDAPKGVALIGPPGCIAAHTVLRYRRGKRNSSRPVSYTHLDVYKRQEQRSTIAFTGCPLWRRLPMSMYGC